MATMYTAMVFALAELSSTIPTAGGGYGFARRAMGPWGGFMTGTAILIEYTIAPAAVAWGKDNRTCSMRVVGHGSSLRVENRLPGGDVNPYLAIAAMIAAGLHGMDNELPLEDEFVGNAYEADKPRVPTNLREARELFANSEVAKEAFGEEVVEHYLNMARVEIEAFEAAVTDWERYRTFERL
jgi:glutamine synthetase